MKRERLEGVTPPPGPHDAAYPGPGKRPAKPDYDKPRGKPSEWALAIAREEWYRLDHFYGPWTWAITSLALLLDRVKKEGK